MIRSGRHLSPQMRIFIAALVLLHATSVSAQSALEVAGPPAVTRRVARYLPPPQATWMFSAIRTVAVDGQDRVYVLEDTEQTIQQFDRDGRWLRSIGRRGGGPGEFTGARWLQIRTDTLFVADTRAARLSAFSTRTGQLLRHAREPALSTGTLGLSPSGAFVIAPSGSSAIGRQLTLVFSHTSVTSPRRTPLLEVSAPRRMSYTLYLPDRPLPNATRLGVSNVTQPFDKSPLYQIGPSGRSLLLVERTDASARRVGLPFGGSTAAGAVRVLEIGWKGDTISDRRYTVRPRAVTPQDLRALIDSFTAPPFVIRSQRPIADPREVSDSLERAREWPSVLAVHVGDDGALWLQQPLVAGRAALFWRVSATGRVLQPVEVPIGLVVHGVREKLVWGVAEDANGVPHAELFEVVSARPL